MASFLAATGPKSVDGGSSFRQEIRDLYRDTDMFNLFILGLERYYKAPINDRKSYYQIAGIHGRPAQAWDNVPGRSGARAAGYCTHSSILFPTWHRPYLAVYEQCLWEHVQAAAAEFDILKDPIYSQIAPNFRMPYWDWAQDPTLPSWILTERRISVNKPSGPTTIDNPLYSYKFQTRSAFPSSPWNTWVETVRNPLDSRPNPAVQPAGVNRAMSNNYFNYKDRTFELLTSSSQYASFSNTAIHGSNGTGYESVEGIHDSVHGNVGLGGHMGVVDYSAFDPIFWLHHTNIDRITALWQAIWPNSWVTNQRSTRETFSEASGTVQGINSELKPFHADQRTYWTSSTIRDVRKFGSVYPELATLGVEGADVRGDVIEAINNLYNQDGPANMMRRLRAQSRVSGQATAASTAASKTRIPQTDGPDDEPEEAPEGLTVQQPGNYGQQPGKEEPYLKESIKYDDYSVLIRVKKHAVRDPFFIHVFLGDFNPDPKTWNTEKSLVGSHYVFVSPLDTTECGKCKEEEDLVVTGKVPLTGAIIDHYAELNENLDRENVKEYLTKHLHWRITKGDADSTPVERDEIPSLKIAVRVREVEDDGDPRTLPVYGDVEVLSGITEGRPCGYAPGDEI